MTARSRCVTVEGHRLPEGVEHLGTETVCNIRVPVVRASVADVPQLREADGTLLDGWFDGERGIVFVRRGLSRTFERDARNHELYHALVRYSGARDFLIGVMKSPSMAEDHEETFIRIMTPHLPFVRWVK